MAKGGKIPGQGQPIDAATDLLWRDNANFAEVFSKIVFKGIPVDPKKLNDLNNAESAMIRMNEGSTTTLKQTRDVVKSLESTAWLVILGIENQTHIDYLMPFRIYELNFINLARQVDEIRRRHKAEQKATKDGKGGGKEYDAPKITEDEYLSGFYAGDRLNPVITLVIYYGEDEWKKPLRLSDLFKESPFKSFADDMPMYLLDVRHMDKEKLDEFSPNLKAFFGFLKYDKTNEFDDFLTENDESFSNLPDLEINALAEITHSEDLKRFKDEYRTSKGGVNVCYGIQELKKKNFVEGIQLVGSTVAAAIEAFVKQFNVDQEVAEAEVKKYWKTVQK